MTQFTGLKLVAIMALAAMVAATPAWATLQVNVGGTISGGTVTGGTFYTDNMAGDVNPDIDEITLLLGGIFFDISTFGGTSGSPIASLTTTGDGDVLTPFSPFTIDLFISDSDFSLPPTPLFLQQTVNINGVANGPTATVTAVGYFGDSNTNFDLDGVTTAPAVSTVTGGAVGPTGVAVSPTILSPTPYSLTTHVQLSVASLGSAPVQSLQINSNLTAQSVPEPASILVLGTALLGATALFRKKSKRTKEV